MGADTLISGNDIIGKIIDGKMIKPASEDKFHLLDHKLMEISASMHKELGRFCDEKDFCP